MPAVRRELSEGRIRWGFDKIVQGRRLRSPVVFLTKARAEAAEAEAVHAYLTTGEEYTPPPPPEPEGPRETTFEVFVRWVNWLAVHRSPRHAYNMRSLFARAVDVAPDLAEVPADELTEDEVEAWGERWTEELLDRGRGLHTVNDFFRYAQTAFSEPWGRRRARRIRPDNPFAFVDRYSVERRAKFVPTRDQVAALLLASSGEFRLYLEIVSQTAARVGEARALAWEDVDLSGAPSVVLYTRKTATGDRTPRRLSITPELAREFSSWRRLQAQGRGNVAPRYVFEQGEQNRPRVDLWIRKNLKAACERAEVPYFPPGCFRHYRASAWAAEGADLAKIRRRLGHSKATTTDRYLHELGGV